MVLSKSGYSHNPFTGKEKRSFLQFAIEKVKQHTRNYAKRQITWFKRNDKIIWMTPSCDFMDKILELFER